MTTTDLPIPGRRDGYGHARMPRQHTAPQPSRIDRVEYGRFRNVYVYQDYAKPLVIASRAAISEIFRKPTTRRVKC